MALYSTRLRLDPHAYAFSILLKIPVSTFPMSIHVRLSSCEDEGKVFVKEIDNIEDDH